ncbi:MAG: sigma-70 family RNA polymerase sigma factor [Anaerolineae bacterium]|nr:sigma-70 family RNA polymerase sigma factor [Gloeobacterales cyanobacterium ES-bin-313]
MRVFNLTRETQPSIADALHELAVRLQPLVRQWHAVRRETAIAFAERAAQLARLERAANRVGMVEMHRLLRHLCRQYCNARNTAQGGSFDVEVFEEEVLLLLHERLPQFEPQRGRFSTWLSHYILQEAFSSLQRSVNPRWGRPAAITERGRLQQQTARHLAQATSASRAVGSGGDAPPDLLEGICAVPSDLGETLLEQQCHEQFLQAVEQLSEANRLLLERIFLRSEVKQDVARSMGCSPGRISQKLSDIKKRLAELLGPDFNDECGETSFCCGAQCARRQGAQAGKSPRPQPAGASVAQDLRNTADLIEAIPELLHRSGWPGVTGVIQPCSDPAEQDRWDQLMAKPVPPQNNEWWYLGAIAAGITVVLLASRARLIDSPTPQTLARDPLPPPEHSHVEPQTKTVPHPSILPNIKPPSKSQKPTQTEPSSTALPNTTPPRQKLRKPTKALPPSEDILQVPLSVKRSPAPLIATAPETTVLRGNTDAAARSYAGALCKAVSGLPQQPNAEGPTVLAVQLAVMAGQVHLEKAPEVLLSGGADQDRALLDALQALQTRGLPRWPNGAERTAHFLLTFDNGEQQPLDCRPE